MFSTREVLPSKTVAEPSLTPKTKANINVPRFNKNTILATATPARTVNRQLPSCFVVSRSRVDDSSDMRPVCDVSLDNVVLSAILASTQEEEECKEERGRLPHHKGVSWLTSEAHDMHVDIKGLAGTALLPSKDSTPALAM